MSKRKSTHHGGDEPYPKRAWNKYPNNGKDETPRLEVSGSTHLENQTGLFSSSKERLNISEGGTDRRLERREAENGKVTKLLEALDEFSQLGSAGISESILKQCNSLRGSLKELEDQGVESKHSNPRAKKGQPTPISLYEHSPQAPAALSILPWTPSSIPTTLPPLPAIYSPNLETAVFTHIGVTSHDCLSYERLEWVGDAYIELISTLLISSTFTVNVTGRLSQLRETCVKNSTLASYAHLYGFSERIRLPSDYYQTHNVRYKDKYDQSTKVMGDIFEAYVAAVILSDPEDGLARVSNWLRALWAQTLASDIKTHEVKKQTSTTGTPIVGQIYRTSKELLSMKLVSKGIKLTYADAAPEFKDPKNKMPVFTVGVYLNGWGEKYKELGTGSGMSKKEAGMKAAEMALANTWLLSKYVEMKISHDENLRKGKEATALQGGNVGANRVVAQRGEQKLHNEKSALSLC